MRAVEEHALGNSLGGSGLIGTARRQARVGDGIEVGLELINNIDVRSKALNLGGRNILGNRDEIVDVVDCLRIFKATEVAASVGSAGDTTTGKTRSSNRQLFGESNLSFGGRCVQESAGSDRGDGDGLRKNGEQVSEAGRNILTDAVVDKLKVIVSKLSKVG